MERAVKERLVGAAVLMAAAIILIPEMLSGPDRGEAAAVEDSEAGHSEAPIKTYTIDFTQPPGLPVASTVTDNRVPPPEDSSPAAGVPKESAQPIQAMPEPAKPPAAARSTKADAPAEKTSSPAKSSVERPSASVAKVVEPPTKSAPPARPQAAPAPRPLASRPATPTSHGWAVQLGSFSNRSSAEQLMKELRGQQHDAFVMPIQSGGATLYRVRIGPMPDRASAEAKLRSVKARVPGAAVVTHP